MVAVSSGVQQDSREKPGAAGKIRGMNEKHFHKVYHFYLMLFFVCILYKCCVCHSIYRGGSYPSNNAFNCPLGTNKVL